MRGTINEILTELKDEMDVGETRRHNHEDCPAGEDSKRRLYVTRKPDVLLGYCHNCGQSSSKYVSTDDRYRLSGYSTVKDSSAAKDYILPTAVSFKDTDNIPAEAEVWRIKNKLTREQCAANHIAYDPVNDGIILPFWRMEHLLDNGHQLRPVHQRGGAKYVNYVRDHDVELGGILKGPGQGDILVIVEDLVSGIHIREAGFDALVNYGTQVKPMILYQIPDHYKEVVVWLDNDNDTVIDKSKQMYDILHLYGNRDRKIRRISNYEDPKHYDSETIDEIVKDGCIRS